MTTLTLYNTLTRSKQAFTPIDPNNVRMYVCGPTVYDFAHIGNARPVIVFDVLYRLLKHLYPGTGTAIDGSRVTYVRNITDVDDKINARALRDFPELPLNDAIRRVTEKTESQFLSDAAALGALEPTIQPRATDNIAQMQALISDLIANNHAYNASGEVLFDVKSMPDYGQLSGRNLEDNLAGARIAVEAHKKNPADFVLWKQSSESEPGWDSPWGRGRPGWHIECSAMSERYLGQTFDIHGGGLDLIFPHHENEIAQSRCAHGTHAMANVWMHNGFLQVEGQKMSKSLGNFVTINELLETDKFGGRKWQGDVLRFAMLMTDYMDPIDFSVDRLWQVQKKLRSYFDMIEGMSPEDRGQGNDHGVSGPSDDLIHLLSDNLRTSALESHFDRLMQQAAGRFGGFWRGRAVVQLWADLDFLGFDLRNWNEREMGALGQTLRSFDASAIEESVSERLSALNSKDFARADAIRNDLAEQGISLMDYKDEAGQRQTKWEIKR